MLNVLLVFFGAMKARGKHWPVISEEVQQRCLALVTGRVRFIEGLIPQLQTLVTLDAVGDHPEPQLLAYVFGNFKGSGLLCTHIEAEKVLMLAALNLVECIAETALPTTS